MLASSRQLAILEIVNRDGGAQLRHLADLFGVSTGTIRRDLTMLDTSGLVARVHGGAVARPATGSGRRQPLRSAAMMQRAARAMIAAGAARMVAPGTSVSLPAGPISELLAGHLATVPGLTVVTSSLPVAQMFRTSQDATQTLVLTGGVYGGTQRLTGPLAAQAMHSLNIDTGFVEFDGVDGGGLPAHTDAGAAELDLAVMVVARRVVCYADHTAWHRLATHGPVTPRPGLVLLIDPQVHPEARDGLAAAGISAVVAHGNDRPPPAAKPPLLTTHGWK